MPWSFKIQGADPPRRIDFKTGVTLLFGRSESLPAAFPDDHWMSSTHFAAGVSNGVLRVQNLSKTNGTEVNGKMQEDSVLQPGDQVKAGNTIFEVAGPQPSPYPAQVRVGGWGFETIPHGWQPVENVGFRLAEKRTFQANIKVAEEPLPAGLTLAAYVENQMKYATAQIPGIAFEPPLAVKIRGAEEAFALLILIPGRGEHEPRQRQIYALSSGTVGVLTATVSEAEPHEEALAVLLQGISYFQG